MLDDDDDGELGEDNFLDSPLDKIEPYQMFKGVMMSELYGGTRSRADADEALTGMQQEQPQFYGSLTGQLSADQQNVLQSVMVRADEISVEQMRAAEQAAQQANLAAQQQQQTGGPTQG